MQNPDLLVSDLCEHMGLNKLILNRKLKSLLNTTANAWIRSLRIRRAAELLRTGRYAISEVTYDVGFNDLRYFRQCFKNEMGILPQDYKKQISE